MDIRQTRKVLSESLKREEELIELIEECLKDIFKEDAQSAIAKLNFSIEGYEYNGCFESLESIRRDVEEGKQAHQKWLESQKKKDK